MNRKRGISLGLVCGTVVALSLDPAFAQSTGVNDGIWKGTFSCESGRDEPASDTIVSATVSKGNLTLERSFSTGSDRYMGVIQPDGSASLSGYGGTAVRSWLGRFKGRFTGDKFEAHGYLGDPSRSGGLPINRRECHIALSGPASANTVAAAPSAPSATTLPVPRSTEPVSRPTAGSPSRAPAADEQLKQVEQQHEERTQPSADPSDAEVRKKAGQEATAAKRQADDDARKATEDRKRRQAAEDQLRKQQAETKKAEDENQQARAEIDALKAKLAALQQNAETTPSSDQRDAEGEKLREAPPESHNDHPDGSPPGSQQAQQQATLTAPEAKPGGGPGQAVVPVELVGAWGDNCSNPSVIFDRESANDGVSARQGLAPMQIDRIDKTGDVIRITFVGGGSVAYRTLPGGFLLAEGSGQTRPMHKCDANHAN